VRMKTIRVLTFANEKF